MVGNYRGTNFVIKITQGENEYIVGVVEGIDLDFGYAGGPEPYFGSRTKKHSAGSKTVSFTIRRWYYADTGQEDLLLDLFQNETEFTLEGYLIDKNGNTIGNTTIKLLNCRLYRWRPRTGGADDIIGEEASGYALDWDFTGFSSTS